jgi:hypothetical protein
MNYTLTAVTAITVTGTKSALQNRGIWETNMAGHGNISGATDERLDD